MTAPAFEFRLPPFKHQLDVWTATREVEDFAIFWEQGTGKTKLAIDTAAWLYLQGRINCVIILAPNNVHRNWTEDEIPTHIPLAVKPDSLLFMYDTDKARNKGTGSTQHPSDQKSMRRALAHDGLLWVAISYNSIMTDQGKTFLWKLLQTRKTFYVADESIDIKSMGAKTTIRALASAKYADYRRILNGTPVDTGPFDVYSQMMFINENFWKKQTLASGDNLGLGDMASFKARYGVWETGYRYMFNRYKGRSEKHEYPVVKGYHRLDELRQIMASSSSRVLKKDVLDLPPKLYSKRYFDLNDEQRRVYEELRDEHMAFLENGDFITTPLPIVKLLRWRQICSGYVPTENPEDEPYQMLGKTNPKLDTLKQVCEATPHKAIIFCNFRMDAELICSALGSRAVRYDGSVDDDQRALNKRAFQEGDAQFFVGNPAACGRGLTLHAAQTVIFYNNNYRYMHRMQSEDRAHRAGLKHPVNYIDLCASQSVDKSIIRNLINKRNVADDVTGDEAQEWL